jgi:cytoskeletal protein RodZ
MATVGEQLHRAREDAGLTLRHVADQTKIQQWILAAIERDDLSQVPGGVFIRGYLMSFARAVGLDGERIWAEYRAERPVRTVEPDPVPVPRQIPYVGPWTLIRVASIVLVAIVIWRNATRSNPDIAAPQPSAPQERATDAVPAAAPTKGTAREAVTAVDSERVAPSTTPLQLRLHATSEVWLEAKVDGERRIYRLLAAGEDVSLDARTEISLRVGDAAAVTYTINGTPGRPFGGSGVVRDVVISPNTYQSFL